VTLRHREVYAVAEATAEKDADEIGWGVSGEALGAAASFVTGEAMGRNAQRLMNPKRLSGVDVGVRLRGSMVLHKFAGTVGIPYHQDSAEHGSDRVGEMTVWMALAEVMPEMGAMRFVDRSHREGPLGNILARGGSAETVDADDLVAQYPKLVATNGLSPPFHYRPGDATVHGGYTIHGSPANATDEPRVSFLFSYMPADIQWWNGATANHGSTRTPLSDETNPVIYPAA
jgi:hypothetical protein